MSVNISSIKSNSRKVYDVIARCTRCTFAELQGLCHLANTDLCMALVQLIRENKIEQKSGKQGVYYCLSSVLG